MPYTDGQETPMPDDDWALGQNLVDVRNEERRARQQHDVYRCTIDESAGMAALALCTQDEQCKAEPDQHQPDCPVEQQLTDELGF